MKKYFIIAAAAALTLASCSKVTLDEEIANQEISFQVANYVAATKAQSENAAAYPTNVPFGTSAWFKAKDGEPDQVFMVKQEISHQATSETATELKEGAGVWKANGATYYWPRTGSLTFVSFSPFTAAEKITELTSTSIKVAGFDATTGVDLMFADKVSGVTEETNKDGQAIESGMNTTTYGKGTNNYAGVPTLFRHALAKLSFKIVCDENMSANVSKVELGNIYKVGGVDLTLDGNKWVKSTTTNANVWTGTNLQANTDYSYSEELNEVKTTAVACANAKDIIVIPQALVDQTVSVTANITVTLPQKGADNKNLTYTYEHTFVGKLTSTTLPSWEMNKNITYTITLKQGNEVTFDPAVAEWSDITTGAADAK